MSKASETVESIRALLPQVGDGDVFANTMGGYLIDTGDSVIAVDATGATSEMIGDWETGYTA